MTEALRLKQKVESSNYFEVFRAIESDKELDFFEHVVDSLGEEGKTYRQIQNIILQKYNEVKFQLIRPVGTGRTLEINHNFVLKLIEFLEFRNYVYSEIRTEPYHKTLYFKNENWPQESIT
jgi:hypothetical protein